MRARRGGVRRLARPLIPQENTKTHGSQWEPCVQFVKKFLLQGVLSPELRPQTRFGAQPPQSGGII